MKRVPAWLLLPLLLLLSIVFATETGQAQQGRHPCRYLIPEGYVGWVQVDYQIEGAPVLPIEDGYRVYKFPPSGRLQTSSAVEVGTYADLLSGLKDEYYYYSPDTQRPLPAGPNRADGGMIWGHGDGQGGSGTASGLHTSGERFEDASAKTYSYEYFFVGTEEEYKNYRAQDENRADGPE